MGGKVFVPAGRREWLMTWPDLLGVVGSGDTAARCYGPECATLDGEEFAPCRIARAMLEQREVLLVGDPPNMLTDLSPADVTKLRVLRQHFRLVRSVQVQGGQVSLYIRDPLNAVKARAS